MSSSYSFPLKPGPFLISEPLAWGPKSSEAANSRAYSGQQALGREYKLMKRVEGKRKWHGHSWWITRVRIVSISVKKYASSIFLGNMQSSWFMFCFSTFNRAMGTEKYFFTIKNNIASAMINVSWHCRIKTESHGVMVEWRALPIWRAVDCYYGKVSVWPDPPMFQEKPEIWIF